MEILKTIGVSMLWGVGGYIVGLPVGWWLWYQLSNNRYDRQLEAAFASAMFVAPLVAVIAAVAGGIHYTSR